jgi:hypothetical protein
LSKAPIAGENSPIIPLTRSELHGTYQESGAISAAIIEIPQIVLIFASDGHVAVKPANGS